MNATRATTPSVSPLIASRTRRKNLEGASHPSCEESSSIPSVGSCSWKKGAATIATIATATPVCAAPVRSRSERGRRQTTQTTSSSSGKNAVALISAPHVRIATAQSVLSRIDAPRRDADGERHEEIVVTTRRRLEQDRRVQTERRDGEDRPRRPDTTSDGGDHERRREARSDRDQSEHVDEHVEARGCPRDDAGQVREQWAVDRGRVHPFRPDEFSREEAREIRRGLHVRVRVMDRHDLPVGDVGVDVSRDQQWQQHDREMESDRQPERETHRDSPPPRGAQ